MVEILHRSMNLLKLMESQTVHASTMKELIMNKFVIHLTSVETVMALLIKQERLCLRTEILCTTIDAILYLNMDMFLEFIPSSLKL